MKILSVVGARPNFMKIAPVAKAIKKQSGLRHILIHTGQHYDYEMSESFFRELGIPKPDRNLEVGSASHAQQTGLIMTRFEKVLLKYKPDIVLVVGDVNSTMACAIVATKMHIPVAHIEAGLRSFDRRMPEEINRLVTDSVADILFTTCKDANKNLIREGIRPNKIFMVGNVMIDNLKNNVQKAKKSTILKQLDVKKKRYALVTLHRPSNVDDKKSLTVIVDALKEVQKKIKVVFPIHPRTRKNIKRFIPHQYMAQLNNLILVNPLGYYDFLNLMMNACLVMTDSGGIQEETTVLGIPCLTVRENTERPVTITEGTNVLVGLNKKKIIFESLQIIKGRAKKGRIPRYWDGKASQRIVKRLCALEKRFQKQ